MWLIVLAAAVAGIASFFATRAVPRVYETKTTIMIGRFISDPNPDSGDFWISEQLGQTYAQLATREPVLQGAIDSLQLNDQIHWGELAQDVRVSLVSGTQLMEIYVSDTNPQRAKALADGIAEQLILQSPSNPSSDQEDRRVFAQEQLVELEAKIENAGDEIESLQAELDEATSARRIQELETQINALQDKESSWQSSYAQFLTFLQGGEVNYLTMVEPAAVPTAPVSPRVELNILSAVAIAVTLAVGAAFLLEFLDDTIKTPQDLERYSALSTLGSILRIEDNDSNGLPVAVYSPRAPAVEAYRSLRTNVQLASMGKSVKILVVTSTGPSEGKSTIAANLSVVLAQAGLRTVLIDADLRRPTLHHMFELPNSGLSNMLLNSSFSTEDQEAGRDPFDQYLQPTVTENLRVITSGSAPPNPAELLSTQMMKQLLENVSGKADIVVIDSPPVLVVTDAVVLSSLGDGVLVVVRSGQTRHPKLRRAIEALQRTDTPILGAVLNNLPSHGEEYYYHYGQPAESKREKKGDQRLWKRSSTPAGQASAVAQSEETRTEVPSN